ncbi:MAG: tetratricopeptide repeat protein [Candidatus Eisenbacteria bacterium]|nr:tetratricopeptide repeat protein [Candidatus Eisenbacteria bacterium]
MRSIIYTAPDSAAAAVVPALGPATPRTTASRASARQSIHRPAVAIVFAAILCWGYTAAWAGIPAEETEPAPRALHQVDEGEHNDERSLELFIEAGVLASKNRHYEAIDKYEQALQLDRSANAIALPLAESFFETSQVDSARSYAESVLGDTTQVAAARRLLARCDLYQGDAEGAIANLRASLDQAPDDQWAFLNLLSLLQRRGKLDEALALLEPAIPENLATAHIYTRRAALRSQLGRHVDALRDLAEALRKDPEYPGTETALVQELGSIPNPGDVKSDVESLLIELPDLVELRRAWITVLSQTDDWSAIGPQLQAYLSIRPQDGRAQLQAGLLALKADDRPTAEAHLLSAAALLDGDPEPYRWLWRLHARGQNWAEALAAADSILSRSPQDVEGLWFKGLAYDEAGRSDDAVQILRELTSRAPGHRPGVFLLSALLSTRDDWAGAEGVLTRYLEAEPKDGEALLRCGIAQERIGEFDRATSTLQTAIQIDPRDHVALNYLGYMWLEKGFKAEEAMTMIGRALELDPGNPAYLDSYGWGYYLRGDYAEAIRYLEEAVSKAEEHPDIRSHLGQVYEAVGRPEDALVQYRKALQYNPEDAELLERVGRLDTSEK